MKLRTKITLLAIVIAVTVSILLILSIRGVFIGAFRGELEKRAVSTAGNLADRIANHILLGDYFQATRALQDVLEKEKDIEYIFATNQDGRIVAHTFKQGLPDDLLNWNPLGDSDQHIQLLDTETGYVRDAGVRIFTGTRAQLHIGIREDSLKDTLSAARRVTYPLILLVVVAGIIASLIMSRYITGPLHRFVEFTKILGRGEYGTKLQVSSSDEIGYLARSFNTLSMQLKTAKEKMEEAFTYTHLLETEKVSSIGQISAGLAHELKNPMTTLKMMFQAFREQPDMTREDAEIISNEIETIDRILNNFLGFVRQKNFNVSEIDLNELIDRVLTLAYYAIDNSGITVNKELLGSLPHIRADRALMEHVFLNLVLNSVQSMSEGGEIRISGRSDERFVEIMIWDRGSGIPPEIRDRVFSPFFTTKEDGTGLGLSIAYNIVKSHGGSLSFHSNEGAGTVFTVRLPGVFENG